LAGDRGNQRQLDGNLLSYVFAGFRFLFTTLLLLLAAAPVVALITGAALTLRTSWAAAPGIVDWLGIGVLALTVIWVLSRSVGVSGVLLTPPENYTQWDRAALGLSPVRSVGLTLLTLILFSLTALWLQVRWQGMPGTFEWLLSILLAVQSFLLPIQHGTFFADRNVRVLSSVPAVAPGLVPPVAVIDGNAEHATLLGRTDEGDRVLATVTRDDLNGVGVRRKVSLAEFTNGRDPVQRAASTGESAKRTMSDTKIEETSWFTSLLERINMTLAQIGSLGDSGLDEGRLWVVDVKDDGSAGAPRRVGTVSDLASPVAGGGQLFAIRRGRLIEMISGEPRPRGDPEVFWHKLVGALPDGTVIGIILDAHGAPRRAVVAGDGSLKTEGKEAADEVQMAFLLEKSRSYTEDRALRVDRPDSRQGFDVFFKTARGVQNVSDCQGDACGHPSLSSDGKLILFIRQSRY
jgi:hypothetical protein